MGDRRTMTVYDCDDSAQADALASTVEADRLGDRNLLQTFGPDTLVEARNRGFRIAR